MSIYQQLTTNQTALAVIGLGYVGLPLAIAFSKKINTIGYDISPQKISAYQQGIDPTGELTPAQMAAGPVNYTNNPAELKNAKFHIIAVPTPVNQDNKPDLSYVTNACTLVGQHLTKGAIVVCESTVYPGVTETICIPALEKASGLTCGQDFTVGYSPERINPSDKVNVLETIVKVVAGQDPYTLEEIANTYALVIDAGVHKVSTIKVAEAVKVIENTQRDVNIAFINEVAMMLESMNIDTHEVIEAMNTKWNALHFVPGLVGGHCISVDPYYLLYQVDRIGHQSRIIRESRRVNNIMSSFVCEKVIRYLSLAGQTISTAKVAILGITFKADTADVRNSKVVDLVSHLNAYGINPCVVDPVANKEEVAREYSINLTPLVDIKNANAIVLAVNHNQFKQLTTEDLDKMFAPTLADNQKVIIDIQSMFNKQAIEAKGWQLWRL